MRYKIGYIDEEPSQVAKYQRELRENFDVIGYDIPKGLPIENLIDQVYKSDIDLLLIDYLMMNKGQLTYNGDEVAREFEKIKPRFPILIFTNNQDDAFPAVDNPNIIYEKEKVKNLPHFTAILNKNIFLYKNYISERKNVIAHLLEKGKKERLTSEERHILLDNELELKGLDKRLVEVPLQLLDLNNIENLSKKADEAEAFLKSLLNDNS